ncbi:hypothetical protein PTT_12693 [Pyrenophora teres f. teres 0-1]|uniref:Uncharacterized protein n=1 Tax=Pyrenophora teres f. teres (strain 0-1) TaxID=861557 RepID=E3RUE0_PYRTT|nr:hypothetical protein PTT_12693 [Pyrenophora teres f. teres 0-1]
MAIVTIYHPVICTLGCGKNTPEIYIRVTCAAFFFSFSIIIIIITIAAAVIVVVHASW